MIVGIIPSPAQVRWYAQSALNGFGTLDREDAIENAQHELRALLAYLDALDAADDPVLVLSAAEINPGVGLEVRRRNAQIRDLPDLKIVRPKFA